MQCLLVILDIMLLSISRPSKGEVPDDEYSVFDTLRDTIYSEVAAVIAGNEGRPHFLVYHLIHSTLLHSS